MMIKKIVFIAWMIHTAIADAQAQEPLYPVSFFDNSNMPGNYFFSEVKVIPPASFTTLENKIPVAEDIFHTAPNSLHFSFSGHKDGLWNARIYQQNIRGRDFFIQPNYLSLWIYNKNKKKEKLSLSISLIEKDSSLSADAKIEISASNKWEQVLIPVKNFSTDASAAIGIGIAQHDNGAADLYMDDIELLASNTAASISNTPTLTLVKGYSKHIDISWQPVTDSNVRYIEIHRSEDGINFAPVGIQQPFINRFADYTGKTGQQYFYKICLLNKMYQPSSFGNTLSAYTKEMTHEELLSMVQEAAFRYYWEGAEKISGLAKENIPGRHNMVASGAAGFGIMALLVGTERNFITRQQSVERFLQITSFLERSEKFHGAFSHFIDGPTGKVETFFGKRDNGGDLVETSFLIQGLLAAKAYFNRENDEEKRIRESITRIWEGVEWSWYRRYPDNKFLLWHWSPDQGWVIDHKLIGWNETMVTYLLAIASPTHSVPASMYYSGWASQDVFAQNYRKAWGQTPDGSMYSNGNVYQGIKLDVGVSNGGPLFFTHYSYLGYDPHQITDKYTNYFTNNQHIANINLRYCMENPGNYKGYSDSAWGLTASDGPYNYSADEPVLRQDKGKIAPTGAISSFPYTPEASMKALKNYYNNYGKFLWGPYGFKDAFNLTENWCSGLYMGLNQAPMVVMIENYRTGLVWKLFMSNPEIQEGLKKIQNIQTP